MRIINLTPHDVVVESKEGEKIRFQSSGQLCRCVEDRKEVGVLTMEEHSIPAVQKTFGKVEGLPNPQPETGYIVSALAAQAAWAEGRTDVFCPGDPIRNEEGQIIGCKALCINPNLGSLGFQEITWTNKKGSRNRKPWLILIKDGVIYHFQGSNIPKVVVVLREEYEKAGSWSNYTYTLKLGRGVRYLQGREGWGTGLFLEGLGDATRKDTPSTWEKVASCLEVSVVAAEAYVRKYWPGSAKQLDTTDQALKELEEDNESSVPFNSMAQQLQTALNQGDDPKEEK